MKDHIVMKSIFRLLAGAILSVLLLSACGDDYVLDVYGSISGKVTDVVTGEPLPAAQVTLVPGANTIQTTSDGTFSFTGLEEGQYTVSVQKAGYQPNRKNVTVVSGETTEVVVTLSVIPKS